jgi:hypothetical protein
MWRLPTTGAPAPAVQDLDLTFQAQAGLLDPPNMPRSLTGI